MADHRARVSPSTLRRAQGRGGVKRILAILFATVGVLAVVAARSDSPVPETAAVARIQPPSTSTTGAPTTTADLSEPATASTVTESTPASTTPENDPASAEPAPPEPVTLLFTGDVTVHVAVADSARTGPGAYDFNPMFEHLAPVIQAADLAICHLETPLDPASGTPRGFPRFSAPAEIAPALANAGFDGCSTASNHVLDRGVSGVSDTLDVLDGAGLGHTGSARAPEGRDGVIYEVGDVVVGHASYSYAVSGWLRSDQQWAANGLNEEQILADARELRERGAEFVVISLHWGIEFRYTPTSSQVTLGAALMESPLVDLIVGHHAHVLQPVEVVNGKGPPQNKIRGVVWWCGDHRDGVGGVFGDDSAASG